MEPLVSIILPTFRRGDNGYLNRAIQSIMMQSYPNFELIIIDDGSKDSTQRVISSYNDGRIRNIRHDANCGLHARRLNEGIGLSRGEYISFMFDDDYWLPDHLRTLVTHFMRCSQEYGMAFGYSLCINAQTREIELLGDEYNPGRLRVGNCLGNQGVLVRKAVLYDVGGYDEHPGIIRLCDWDLWLRVINGGYKIYKIPIVTSINEFALPDSIRLTVPIDMDFVYRRIAENRLDYLRSLIQPDRNSSACINLQAGHLIKGDLEPAVYFIFHGRRYLIPSIEEFNRLQFSWDNVGLIPQGEVNAIPDGGVLKV